MEATSKTSILAKATCYTEFDMIFCIPWLNFVVQFFKVGVLMCITRMLLQESNNVKLFTTTIVALRLHAQI